MFELVKAGGWLMLPILACSVVALAIIIERLWTLRRSRVIPRKLVAQVWNLHRSHRLLPASITELAGPTPPLIWTSPWTVLGAKPASGPSSSTRSCPGSAWMLP